MRGANAFIIVLVAIAAAVIFAMVCVASQDAEAVPTAGVAVTPASDAANGNPGDSIVYNLMVENTGLSGGDTYDIAITGNSWATATVPAEADEGGGIPWAWAIGLLVAVGAAGWVVVRKGR